MKSWRFSRLLSLILVLAMLIQMMPVQSFAASTGSSAVDVETGQPVTTVLGEVEDLREEDTKHFRLSDGSYIAVSYGMPVHYADENGSWEDIDNTIVQNSETSTYQLNREDAVVSFANALTNGTVLTTSKDGKSITMSVLDTNQAVQMIAGEEAAELMGEEESETQAAETVPEEAIDETVPEETEAVTETDETVAETEPEETIPETTVAAVEDAVQETVAETVVEAVDTISETTEATEVVDNETEAAVAAVDETVAEETEEVAGETAETQAEETESSAEVEEATAATIPEETEALTVPEETTAPNANFAYFDNISLMREAAQTMRYDEDGNLVSVLSPGLKEDENTFSNGNLIKTVTGGYGTYSYNYDNSTYKHRLTSVSNDLIKQTIGYDGAGNVTSTTLSKKDGGTKSISTSSVYEGNLNRLVSMTDSNGATTTYGYGTANAQMMALPTSITDAKGTVTSNTYDDNYRVDQTTIANAATVAYDYSSGNLTSAVRTNNEGIAQAYNFEYDDFGNMTRLKVGSDVLVTYNYDTGNGLLLKETYANGAWVSYGYDDLGRIKTTSYSDGRMLNYVYNGEGRLHSVTETSNAGTITYLYTYDSLGRLINTEQKQGNTSALRTHVDYNEYNQISGQSWQMGDTAYSETYEYNAQNGSLTEMTTGVNDTLTMGYDELQRLSAVSGKFGRTYSYKDISSTQTTTLVSNLSYSGLASAMNFGYTYDVLGNISESTAPDGEKITYTYDAQGQLLKAEGDTTYNYTYDTVGNILTANGHSYTYGNSNWKDLLVAYDGQTISYDASGNPTNYYNGTRWNFTWANGRNLATAAAGTTNASFSYDSDGLRTSKTVGTATTNYLYSEGKLLRQTTGSNTWDFFYDANGVPYALKYNGTVYYYITNLQGDVIQLVNASGTAVASYEYDPYGNVIEATGEMAEINPLRYRGYYYDSETELYYLTSRYYDPAIGRFINADDVGYLDADTSLAAMDLFAYCANDPVNRFDDAGNLSLPNWAKVAIGVGVIAICAVATVATGGAAAGTLLAAVNCAATGALVGSVTQGAIGAVSGAVSGAVTHRLSTGSWKGAEQAALNGAATGFMTGTITGAISGAVSSPYCFVAGTTVLTAAGAAAIETVQAGDQVWAWNEDTGEVAIKEVVETYVNETDELIHVFVSGEEIVTTPGHPFYSPVKGWTDAIKLRAGDMLVLLNGEYVVVEMVQHEILEAPVTVYNFQVEDFHTYFVADSGVLVHNSCGMTNKEATAAAKKLGYSKVKNASSHGNAVFTNAKAPRAVRYITADVDSHNGGVWKAADTIANLGSKAKRSGTYDAFLRRIGA